MNPLLLFYILYVSTYFGTSLFCYIKDVNGTEKRQGVRCITELKDTYKRISPLVFLNVLWVSPLFVFTLFNIFDVNYTFILVKLPLEVIFMLIFTDIYFYIAHRIVHIPYFYKRIHKIHHELIAPVGLGAFYCHPLEMILVNLPPVILPALLMNFSFYSLLIFNFISTINTVYNAHGGYKSTKNQHHDIHHEKFNVNYGINIFMDKLFNTYYNE